MKTQEIAFYLVAAALAIAMVAACAILSTLFGVFLLFDTMDPTKFSLWMG